MMRNSILALLRRIHKLDRAQDPSEKGFLICSFTRWRHLHTSIRNIKEESTLYVRRSDLDNAEVVEVDLDLFTRCQDQYILKENVALRKMDIDVESLVLSHRRLQKLQALQQEIEANRVKVADQMKQYLKMEKTEYVQKQMAELKMLGKSLKEQMKNVMVDLAKKEDEVMFAALKLPTELAEDSEYEDQVLLEDGVPQSASPMPLSHIEIGKKNRQLEFSSISPGAYYLSGSLALFELNVIDDLAKLLRTKDFQQISSPDFYKSLVIEGCGVDFTDETKSFILEPRIAEQKHILLKGQKLDDLKKFDNQLHLCGGASRFAFAAYLTKTNTLSEHLPIKMFSVGRNYKPCDVEKLHKEGLLAVSQGNQVEVFAASAKMDQCEKLYFELLQTIWSFYKTFKIPIRLTRVGCENIHHWESKRHNIEVWMPSLNSYKAIANVSMCDDFISRRLIMKHDNDVENVKNRQYLFSIHGTALSVPKLLASVMENNQTQGGEINLLVS